MDGQIKNIAQKLLDAATKVIIDNKQYNYDNRNVASALMTKNGQIYTGINIDWWNSTCAECVALGSAFVAGDREIEYIISVKQNSESVRVVSPCGICRQMFALHTPNLQIFIEENDNIVAKSVVEMLPYAYID